MLPLNTLALISETVILAACASAIPPIQHYNQQQY